jgi:hypothetical protein
MNIGAIIHERVSYFCSFCLEHSFTPTWQVYPVLPVSKEIPPYNWNAIQHPLVGSAINETLLKHNVVISQVMNLDWKRGEGNDAIEWTKWASRYISPEDNAAEPLVRILYPVLEIDMSANESNVVAIVASTFFWKSFIQSDFRKDQKGLVVVFENSCNQSFTYKVAEDEILYLGPGDLHDTYYDLELTQQLSDITAEKNGFEYFAGLSLNDEYCAYSITTYPSKEMEASYKTNQPLLSALAAVGIFVFTIITFLAYDNLVVQRQKKVMESGTYIK